MSSFTRFIITFLIITAFFALVPRLLVYTGHPDLLVPKFWVMFIFFSVLTFLICISVLLAGKRNAGLSAQVFLIATVTKLVLCMAFALAYLLKFHVNNVYFLLAFFYLYLSNTVFEVYTLLTNLRNQNSK